MSTPEGKVKAKVRSLLGTYEGVYLYMPVPGGYGQTTLDFLGSYRGRFFAIETKAPGKKPTIRQVQVANEIGFAMGMVFVIDDVQGPTIEKLRAWLDCVTMEVPHDPYITPDTVNRRTI